MVNGLGSVKTLLLRVEGIDNAEMMKLVQDAVTEMVDEDAGCSIVSMQGDFDAGELYIKMLIYEKIGGTDASHS